MIWAQSALIILSEAVAVLFEINSVLDEYNISLFKKWQELIINCVIPSPQISKSRFHFFSQKIIWNFELIQSQLRLVHLRIHAVRSSIQWSNVVCLSLGLKVSEARVRSSWGCAWSITLLASFADHRSRSWDGRVHLRMNIREPVWICCSSSKATTLSLLLVNICTGYESWVDVVFASSISNLLHTPRILWLNKFVSFKPIIPSIHSTWRPFWVKLIHIFSW